MKTITINFEDKTTIKVLISETTTAENVICHICRFQRTQYPNHTIEERNVTLTIRSQNDLVLLMPDTILHDLLSTSIEFFVQGLLPVMDDTNNRRLSYIQQITEKLTQTANEMKLLCDEYSAFPLSVITTHKYNDKINTTINNNSQNNSTIIKRTYKNGDNYYYP